MQTRFSRTEIGLMQSLLSALVFACFGQPVAQSDHYSAIADQRVWMDLPFALDVMGNLQFALFVA